MRPSDIPAIAELSTVEKILLVEDLWDDITSDEGKFAVPESHKKELDRRIERQRINPGRLLSLEELQLRVDTRK
jgi:putative addiction module component (TIGR02574 family)